MIITHFYFYFYFYFFDQLDLTLIRFENEGENFKSILLSLVSR